MSLSVEWSGLIGWFTNEKNKLTCFRYIELLCECNTKMSFVQEDSFRNKADMMTIIYSWLNNMRELVCK
jgi:hypothetical protein